MILVTPSNGRTSYRDVGIVTLRLALKGQSRLVSRLMVINVFTPMTLGVPKGLDPLDPGSALVLRSGC